MTIELLIEGLKKNTVIGMESLQHGKKILWIHIGLLMWQ
jgi:hypothetical protein